MKHLNSWAKTFTVHRLVSIAFLEANKTKTYVNHKDSNKQNNNVNNLEWCTPKENTHHAMVNGARCFTEENKRNSKLILEQVLKIRYLHMLGIKQLQLSIVYGVTIATISNIINNKTLTIK